jgi:hypothetical protein
VSAAGAIAKWRADPVSFVRDNFQVEPDPWQTDTLSSLGGDANPRRRLCMKACTGPGKSAVLAWIGWHRLLCFAAKGEHPKGAALSVTADNLKDNLWAELAKWQARSPLLSAAFKWTKERIYAVDHPETWFLSARSYAKDADAEAIGRALSGLHSQFPFVLLDETGEMPLAVGKTAQQIFTGNPIDALIAQAGNPTSTTGLLYDSCTVGRANWVVITITADPDDPKRTPRVSTEHAREMIEAYGRDNPWVMATILGLFPPSGLNQLLGPDDVERAMSRIPTDDGWRALARIVGVDVARFGDDESVIARRNGQVMLPLEVRRNVDSIQGAGWAAQAAVDFFAGAEGHRQVLRAKADRIFVDDTGGWGAGWIDQLRVLGHPVTGVGFAGKADDPRYFNKRSEMHFRLADAIKTGGLCLPKDPHLARELVVPLYYYQGDRMRVEEKDQIKARLGKSPDRADAAALTYAFHVTPGPRIEEQPMSVRHALESMVADSYGSGAGEPYNPMG